MNVLNTIANAQANMNATNNNVNAEKEIAMNNAVTVTTNSNELPAINVNALSSTLIAKVFALIGKPKESVLAGAVISAAVDRVRSTGMESDFYSLLEGSLSMAFMDIVGSEEDISLTTEVDVELDMDTLAKTMGKLKLLNRDGTMGPALVELVEQRRESYAPILGGAHNGDKPFERKFKLLGLEKGQLKKASNICMEAIVAQEKTLYTVDKYMLDIMVEVQKKLDVIGIKDKESYVLEGCLAMDPNQPYSSEFKFDKRFRSYLASCFGPNGQSSDRSRAAMNLWGVEYDDSQVDMITKHIMAEVEDMTSLEGDELQAHMDAAVQNPVMYIFNMIQIRKCDRPVKKVWSFAKAAHILSELAAGNKPYIGMAVGLDAKCSGPQYGGLMAGDDNIAAACGFTLEKGIKDAYLRCIDILNGSSFAGLERGDIKKTFMAIFYGQGWAAFLNTKQMERDGLDKLVALLKNGTDTVTEERAKELHSLITMSFGRAMVRIRKQVLKYSDQIVGRTGHYMPDGAKVQMNYKVKVNVHGEVVTPNTFCPDVVVTINELEYRFKKLALKTKEVDTNSFVRTAFVNMIQATDALIARMIIVHLARLGAKHIIGVHDCFRVNVTEMHLLEEAIKRAYMDVFGSSWNAKTPDFPMGLDILGMFFEGLQANALDGVNVNPISQFMPNGIRIKQKINGVSVKELINRLGEDGGSYFFAK